MAMKGSASVVRSDGSVDAKNGLSLLEHDRIQTQKKSRVQVMLNDNTVVTIGANSSFSFDTFSYDGTKKSKVAMSAQRGFFRSVTGKIGKMAPERFKVKTVSATIGIRGTDFSADVMDDREIIKCYSGVISVTYKGEEKEVVAGMQLEIRKGSSELEEVQPQRKKETQAKSLEKVSGITEQEIPTEVVSDITQIVNDSENIAEEDTAVDQQANDPAPPPPANAFRITPGAEDRPAQY